MGGALLQLVSLGQQDVFLSGNPQITFWKVVYRRHTNFAIETVAQVESGSYPNLNYTISRSGDLIHKCYLKVTVPELNGELSYVNKFGHALIESVSLKIGGVNVDTHTGEFLDIWNELTISAEKQEGYAKMIGSFETEMEITDHRTARSYYIPLQFFFCQHPGLALPLVALQYHEVQINFKLRGFDDMLCNPNGSNAINISETQDNTFRVELFVDYVYLDADERRRMAQSTHEMLITQLKVVRHTVIGSGDSNESSDRINLRNLSHPVKELIWVAKNTELNAQPKRYFTYYRENFENDDDDDDDVEVAPVREIMTSASLVLNGTHRVDERDNLFFRFIQPYQHHTRIPNDYIYVYSFALKPEEIQPSGSCNFSRIDSAYLNVTGRHSQNTEYVVHALNWNVLRIQGGMGGIAFTN